MKVKDSRGNIALAQQLLAQGLREEGLSNMPQIKFTFSQGDDPYFKALSNQWASALGVQVVPESYPFSTYLQKLQNSHGNPNGLQIWESALSASDPDPQGWLADFEPGAANNEMNYGQNTTADAIQEQTVQQQLAQADAETNPVMRLQLYQSAEQQIINQVGWIPLYQWTDTELIKPYVKGMKLNALGVVPPGAWANIYIAAHQ